MRKFVKDSISGIGRVIRKQIRIRNAGAGPHVLSLENDDAGASGLYLDFFRDSPSPAASDGLGYIAVYGRDSGGNKESYGIFGHEILDPANGTEDSKWVIESKVAGVMTRSANFGAGVWAEGATGGDKGAGTINAQTLYMAGSQIPFSKEYLSGNQTITAGGSLTLPHGLGVAPKLMQCWLYCNTAEFGYSIGETVWINNSDFTDGGTQQGVSASPDATNLNVRFGASGMFMMNKGTGAVTLMTTASWRAIFRAWA